jgi:hypothetical protein
MPTVHSTPPNAPPPDVVMVLLKNLKNVTMGTVLLVTAVTLGAESKKPGGLE